MKRVTVSDSYSSQPMPESSNSFSPQYDLSDAAQIERSTKFQNLLKEIKQLSITEVNCLLLAINNFHFSGIK
jgi:hypothetical protein